MAMRRFEFALERLLHLKRQLERQAQWEQQQALGTVEQAQAQVQQLQQQLQQLAEQLAARVGSLVPAAHWVTTAEMSDRLAQALQQAQARQCAAQQQYQQASQRRAQLATEVEALQTLRQQHYDHWRQQVHKMDQQRLDELGLRRWQQTSTCASMAEQL
jgi:flagellar export protein FliJ